ncbi:iron permease [Dichomitus squalens LYAD-421 SS1]|uniref:Iron permease n=1 Tax=Dichomitus squalens (strain LYAD-421) TaxID=732165 RepID=R7SJA0_DICSQ|nr:iron permease [Dichomitus squalens LYAD-421 SS1]EJF56221.1 iron permease [Dichomitus squalens LYAD-421 SS1]
MSPGASATRQLSGTTFWLSFTAVVVCNFLSALDITAVSTALPTITDELKGGDKFVWVGAAYGLAAAAILPFSGRLADTFGRRPSMLACVAFFFVGSALSGSAKNMNWLIAARTVQGIGGGGIINLASIIVSDLIPLAQRGTYQGFLILTWCFAAAIGPIIGGAFAEKATWRWLFYLNLPLAGIAFVLVACFLRVRTPPGSLREKLVRIDLLGNFIIIVGTTLALVALTWGGIQFPWNSAHVLAPLIVGFSFIALFFLYESLVPKEPTLPFDVLANRTSFSGYFSTFLHGIVSITTIYYFPVYFQACMNASPIRSGVMLFPTALVNSPFSIVAGIIVKRSGKYRFPNYAGWIIMLIGFGLQTMLKADSSTGQWVGFQFLTAVGVGLIWASTIFPILAPIPVTRVASALAFYNFCRTFAQTWGVTISASILQNELKRRLPSQFLAMFPDGAEIAYAAIPLIRTLPDDLRNEVRDAFASSLAIVWKAMVGFSAAGFLTVFLLREVTMHRTTDETYGLQEQGPLSEKPSDLEDSPNTRGFSDELTTA